MNTNDLLLEVLKHVISSKEPGNGDVVHPFEVGKSYFVRTATMAQLGRLKMVVGKFLVLEEASWIADTGRFHDFLKDGVCNEYESFINDCIVPMDSIIEVTEWKHKLFRGQK